MSAYLARVHGADDASTMTRCCCSTVAVAVAKNYTAQSALPDLSQAGLEYKLSLALELSADSDPSAD
jgi:hypothetical protein